MFPFHSDYLFNICGLCMADLVYNFSNFLSPTPNIPQCFLRVGNVKFSFSFLWILENWISNYAVNIITLFMSPSNKAMGLILLCKYGLVHKLFIASFCYDYWKLVKIKFLLSHFCHSSSAHKLCGFFCSREVRQVNIKLCFNLHKYRKYLKIVHGSEGVWYACLCLV